ncbi:MAG TPA: type II toxin-antitoxin system VapC family toxin [Xanthobacteraceae bacterium]|nr:type II toxin-antitoxin system VapC family toxin [Xanthobacteraceae bacterium]
MPLVLDASIAASWYFPDERSEDADRVLDGLEEDSALVPILWWFEVRNVLIIGERRRRSTPKMATEFLSWLASLPILQAELPDEDKVFAFARHHQLTFYDAAYLELAQRESLALATLDQHLAQAARAEGVALVTS